MPACRSCGLEVEAGDVCPECGAEIDEGTQSFQAVMPDGAREAHEDARSAFPVLVVQKGPEVGERFTLDREAFSVGRDSDRDIFLGDVTVSRDHAVLEVRDGTVTIRDDGSLNGTYVNGLRVDEAAVRHGDVIQIGRFQMILLAGGAGE
jgi:hypothetical protein